MSTTKGSATFEFTIQEKEIGERSFHSPIFSTTDNMFWQLEYQPSDPEESNSCILFLTAIPNPEEASSTQYWNERANFTATLFIRTSLNNTSHLMTTNDYSVKGRSWGKCFNKPKSNMSVTFGVTFDNPIMGSKGYNSILTAKPEPKEIIETWGRQLDIPENSDVVFNVKDGIIYANKSILSDRSEYFYGFFKGRWAEISNKRKQMDHDMISASTDVVEQYIIIDVPDISKAVFLEMLRYIYTDEVRFNSVPSIEIFKVADKYLLPKLRQKARVEVFKKLSNKNAMTTLFSEAWKWNDLKDDIVNYIVDNFQELKDTPGYKKLAAEHKGHPAGIEIFQEILNKLLDKQYSK